MIKNKGLFSLAQLMEKSYLLVNIVQIVTALFGITKERIMSKVNIFSDRCKECGLCVAHCPKDAITFADEINAAGYRPVTIDDDKCIACGICYVTCPDGVYEVK
jgi:2-oxoglutarate ferredoxin oxidoreductase subunit delta